MANKILFCPKQPPVIMELVHKLLPAGYELLPADVDTPEFYEAAAQAEYYLGFARRMGNDFFRAAPNLKLVQLTSAGYDQVDPEAAEEWRLLPRSQGRLDLARRRRERAAHLTNLLGDGGDQAKDQRPNGHQRDKVDDRGRQSSWHAQPFGEGVHERRHHERHQPGKEEDQEDRAESAEDEDRLLQQ